MGIMQKFYGWGGLLIDKCIQATPQHFIMLSNILKRCLHMIAFKEYIRKSNINVSLNIDVAIWLHE